MDKKSFEVGGHCPLWQGWKNRMTTQNWQKSNAKKNATSVVDDASYLPILTIITILLYASDKLFTYFDAHQLTSF